MKTPRLSIIIPTRRIDAALRSRIANSLGQLPRTEILVIEPEGEVGSPAGKETVGLPSTGGGRKSPFEPQRTQRTQRTQRRVQANSLRSLCPLWFKLHGLAADATVFATPSPGEGLGRGDQRVKIGAFCDTLPTDEKDAAVSGFRLLKARPGRGPQCNRGAQVARGELLLFLHDDTDLPDGALGLIERAFEDPAVSAACFRLRFDKRSWLLGVYAFFTRFDSLFTTFGDQGLVIRRSFFEGLGGFPDWPLFEDVELGRRIRHHSRIVKLPATVTTSAERFERNGVVRQQLRNVWLVLRFLLGATPETLAASYERRRSHL